MANRINELELYKFANDVKDRKDDVHHFKNSTFSLEILYPHLVFRLCKM